NKLCVEGGWLYGEAQIMTFSQYKNCVTRKQLTVMRRACKNTPALIEWDSLPLVVKNKLIAKYGNPVKATQENHFIKHISYDKNALEFFSHYELTDGGSLPIDRQHEYYHNATILNAIQSFINNRKAMKRALGGRVARIWNGISEIVQELDRTSYPHTLPANERRLKDKFLQYNKEGYQALIHKSFCNNNARKVDAQLERLILSIYCMSNKPYAAWVHEDYLKFIAGVLEIVDMETGEMLDRSNFFDQDKGTFISISEATCWNYINNPKNRAIVDALRTDRHKFTGNIRPHFHRHAPIFGLSKISLDDRDLPRKMHDGNRVKAYYAYDVASGVLIGASYSVKKDADLFIDCLLDTFRFINARNWGMPLEVEVEHHIVGLFKDDLMKAGVVFPFVRFCAPGNSQEKHAEQFNRAKKYGYEKRHQDGIGRFYARLADNQTGGERVYDDINNKYIIKERTYSFEELVADDRASIEAYNNGLHRDQALYKGKTKMQVLSENLNPNLAEINKAVLARYIGRSTTTSIQRNMYCQVQYQKYMLPDPASLAKLSPNNYTVEAFFIPGDVVNEIYLYQNNNFIAECKLIDSFNTSAAESNETDAEAMLNQAKYISGFDKMVKDGRNALAKPKYLENLKQYENVVPEIVPVVLEQDSIINDYETNMDYYRELALNNL
ncbi:MAG: hypothetical protein PHE56_06790, partial [Bacteroidales bacterium]|nr:hypothetical protein [Bacteroidales bacterium]